mmetsp:Transcript_120027/g.345040  ORF Transcript_120027/g.345040 Transcript_120027/m.345040 type:complete len:289 (+) Transcript_120027:285-1151(+)
MAMTGTAARTGRQRSGRQRVKSGSRFALLRVLPRRRRFHGVRRRRLSGRLSTARRPPSAHPPDWTLGSSTKRMDSVRVLAAALAVLGGEAKDMRRYRLLNTARVQLRLPRMEAPSSARRGRRRCGWPSRPRSTSLWYCWRTKPARATAIAGPLADAKRSPWRTRLSASAISSPKPGPRPSEIGRPSKARARRSKPRSASAKTSAASGGAWRRRTGSCGCSLRTTTGSWPRTGRRHSASRNDFATRRAPGSASPLRQRNCGKPPVRAPRRPQPCAATLGAGCCSPSPRP